MAFENGFTIFPNLQTERLDLRQLSPDDAEAYYSALKTVSCDVWGMRQDCIATTRQFLDAGLKEYRNRSLIPWAIIERESGALIGEVKIFNCASQWKAEVAYWLTKNQRRKGYGQEAVAAAVHFGFETLDMHRLEAYVRPDNAASVTLLKKMGFIQEGVLRKFKKEGGTEGEWIDAAVYSLLKEEYEVLQEESLAELDNAQ